MSRSVEKNRRWGFAIHTHVEFVSLLVCQKCTNASEKSILSIYGVEYIVRSFHRKVGKYLTDYTATSNSHSHETELKSAMGTEGAGIAMLSFIHYVLHCLTYEGVLTRP